MVVYLSLQDCAEMVWLLGQPRDIPSDVLWRSVVVVEDGRDLVGHSVPCLP